VILIRRDSWFDRLIKAYIYMEDGPGLGLVRFDIQEKSPAKSNTSHAHPHNHPQDVEFGLATC
jgi:hypothetical protein